MEFFNFLMFDVLSEPAVLVGLIALIGLIAQKKPVTECIKGTVKTIMGLVDGKGSVRWRDEQQTQSELGS